MLELYSQISKDISQTPQYICQPKKLASVRNDNSQMLELYSQILKDNSQTPQYICRRKCTR